ncbi:MAG: major capsid protein [Microvirus sp.]|nr:MAG: major capsid protein [Microvirus sp.]
MKSIMKHMFSEVPKINIPRSRFDRSFGYKSTFDAGGLIPFFVDEALPGDTYAVKMAAFARLATPIYPIMDNMRIETFFFAVPNRLVWDNWARFCGERKSPNDSVDYLVPEVEITNAPNESIYDYVGLPTKISAAYKVSALPFRAINLIWNEWFRDQNLQTPLTVNTGNGPDTQATYSIPKRGKRHDYFTSCLPWLQKGDAIQLSLGESAPISGLGKQTTNFPGTNGAFYETDDQTGAVTYPRYSTFGTTADYIWGGRGTNATGGFPDVYADLSKATSSTVNELRQAIQVQRILERDARAGTRYTEIVQSHFGVISPDARLQRPEYLGGGSSPVNISPVAKTVSDGTNNFTGELGAFGTVGFTDHGFTKSFTEHCIIIGFMNVRADLTYQHGIEKFWNRQTRFDFYWPTLAHLGEQAVLNKEIFISDGTIPDGTAEEVFGYQERYAEYRYKPSKITGKMRSNDAQSLDAWHLSQNFVNQPMLVDIFIEENPPIDRVIAIPTEPHFIFDSYIAMSCVRPMPVYSVPGLIDHF